MDFKLARRVFLEIAGLTAGMGGILPSAISAKEEPGFNDYPGEVAEYLRGLYSEEIREHTFRPGYSGGFSQWQKDWRPILRQLIGLENIAAHAAGHQPTVALEEPEDLGEFTRCRGTIQTEPHVAIPFWLLQPKGEGPFPLAVLPHGHDSRGHDTHAGVFHDEAHRNRTLEGDRDVAVQAVKRGFVAIAPAVRGLSVNGVPDLMERHGNRPCRSQFMHCLIVGRTAIGERVWDMQRIIDWGSRLPGVDPESLLMMGNSGGGMVTLYAGACDERITIAVPSCSFSTLTSPSGFIYHCDCNMVPGILRHGSLYDVAGLIAPRHLLAVNGRKDKLHSPPDIERAAARVQAIYEAAGFPDRFEHRWGKEGHRFYKDLMWPFVLNAMSV